VPTSHTITLPSHAATAISVSSIDHAMQQMPAPVCPISNETEAPDDVFHTRMLSRHAEATRWELGLKCTLVMQDV